MLGVTQASVSLYLAGSESEAYSGLSELSVGRDDADRYASLLAEDAKRNPVDSIRTLTSIWTGLLGKGSACGAHRDAYPLLAQCDVCIHQFGPERRHRSDLVEEARRAVRILESSATFFCVMPEVSVNMACLRGDSNSLDDVVAVPGRIVRVKNHARSMFPPEFGASRHMSRMLLLVRRRMPRCRAAINLAYNKKVRSIIRKLGIRVIEVGGPYPQNAEDPTVAALEDKLLQSREQFDAVAALGGTGIEPSLYLFGETAEDVASLAVRISELYSSAS
jgi:predicted fused transcriptional regulator/phosphomethylpyrimidine kinase/predicted transcriptional regulator